MDFNIIEELIKITNIYKILPVCIPKIRILQRIAAQKCVSFVSVHIFQL